MTSADLLSWLGEASLVLAFAVLLALAVRRVLRRRLGAVWIYALWAAVPAALLASLVPNGLAPLPAGLGAVNAGAGGVAIAAVLGGAGESAGGSAARAAASVWLLGAAAFLAAHAGAQWLFHVRVVRAARRPDREEAWALMPAAAGTALHPAEHFRLSRHIAAPLACGLLRPLVLLPETFLTGYGPQEQRIMALHEAEHVRAGHVAHRAAAALIRCVFWFHPLAWIGERAMAADQELACDAAVLRGEDGPKPSAYAAALLKAASQVSAAPQAPAGGVPLITVNHLKERTAMLTRHTFRGPGRAGGLAAASAVCVAAVLAGLSASAAPTAPAGRDAQAGPDRDARPSRAVPPVYPVRAVEAGLEGSCVMTFDVGADGEPEEVEAAQCTDGVFRQPSIDAVTQWRFDEGRALNGVQTMIEYQLSE